MAASKSIFAVCVNSGSFPSCQRAGGRKSKEFSSWVKNMPPLFTWGNYGIPSYYVSPEIAFLGVITKQKSAWVCKGVSERASCGSETISILVRQSWGIEWALQHRGQ